MSEFGVAYYAAPKLGAIPVTLNAILKTEEVGYLLGDSGARVELTVSEFTRYIPSDPQCWQPAPLLKLRARASRPILDYPEPP